MWLSAIQGDNIVPRGIRVRCAYLYRVQGKNPAVAVRLDRGVIRWSVILYIALLLPVSLLHEAGHAYICSASGYSYSLWLDARGGHIICSGVPADGITYGAMGGVFGMAGSWAMIAIWTAKRHPAILVVGLAYMVDQAAKMVLEGFFTPLYISGATDLFITALQLASWIGFMLYFAKRKRVSVA